MSLIGNYVPTFAAATHALPEGMPMNADYPLMLPRVIRQTLKTVTLQQGSTTVTVPIEKYRGQQICHIEQSSSFERLTNRPPQRFRCFPFRDREQEPVEVSREGTLF